MCIRDSPYSAFLPDDIKIAQIDIKPERLGRRAKVDIGLCGDVKLSIQSLLRMLNPKTDDSFLLKQLKRYEGVKKDCLLYTSCTFIKPPSSNISMNEGSI